MYIETSTSLGSLHRFEGAAGEFKGALGSFLDTQTLIQPPSGVLRGQDTQVFL